MGSIERKIEQDYGLLKGSIQINKLDESDARVIKKLVVLKKEQVNRDTL